MTIPEVFSASETGVVQLDNLISLRPDHGSDGSDDRDEEHANQIWDR